MKYIAVVFLLLFTNAFSQDEHFIAELKQTVARINSDSSYKIKRLDNENFIDGMDNGSSLTGYYKHGELLKMSEWVGLSHGIVTLEYYLNQGVLIFAFMQEKNFPYVAKKDTVYFDYDHPEITAESRLYFKDGRLLKKIVTGDPAQDTNAERFIADCRKYSRLLQPKEEWQKH
jgi:hypothetical protein